MRSKLVFISYSHDSAEHAERVLGLSERLRRDGIETVLDQYVPGSPKEGWPRWMLYQIDAAEFVLVVCTETYYRRFRGKEEQGRGQGADWEGALIYEIYDRRVATARFIPVLLDPRDHMFIPEPLRGHTHYTLNSETSYEALLDFLLGQAGVVPHAVGKPRLRPRRAGSTPTLKLFISHSSHDEPTAVALIDLIRSALGLMSTDIRCTSVDGYRLPIGAATDEHLRKRSPRCHWIHRHRF